MDPFERADADHAGSARRRAPGSRTARRTAAGSGVDGVLYFVDRSCRLRGAAPAGADDGAGSSRRRVPRARLTGIGTAGWSLWPRKTPLVARCEHRRVIVSATAGLVAPDDRWLRAGLAARRVDDVHPPRGDRSVSAHRPCGSAAQPRTARPGARACSGAEAGARAGARAGSHGSAPGALRSSPPPARGRSSRSSPVGASSPSGRMSPIRLRSYARARRGITSCCAHRAGCGCTTCAAARCRAFFASAHRPRSRGPADERWVALARSDRVILQSARRRVPLRLAAVDLAWTQALD